MTFRMILYNLLVNRQPGIAARYHRMHNGAAGGVRVLSWIYLLWLNFAFYVLQLRSLGRVPEAEIYESKRLDCRQSESAGYRLQNPGLTVENFVEKLSRYDVISFDVFDTLIFRPFSLPADVFYLVGSELGILNFRDIRVWAEWDARVKRKKETGSMEVSLSEIWDNLEAETGVSSGLGQELEKEAEQKLCYANPFMLQVWKKLKELDKRIVIVSDMYLPGECIGNILEKAGYTGAEKIYISNEYHRSKADGRLYGQLLRDLCGEGPGDKGLSVIHVGDNPHSDVKQAKRAGLAVLPYQNVNKNVLLYRAFDMSALVGSAYRAVVSSWLYSGLQERSMEYEYGFIYGGLFVLGYCGFIHDYCRANQIDKLLFLSRDGDILKQAYDYLYPEERTEYVYWSRKAAVKLSAAFDRHDYFRRFLFHKVNQGYTISEIFHSMEVDFLADQLCDWEDIWREKGRGLSGKQHAFVELRAEDQLTDKNARLLRLFVEAKWDQVAEAYSRQDVAARIYFENVLRDVRKAAAVDIGWAGSGAMALRHLVEKEWRIPCEIVGMIAGTNTIHNAEPDASEGFLQSGRLAAYLYSQGHNRDLLKKHDQNKGYNIFWEILLSSPTPQFAGFYMGKRAEGHESIRYIRKLDITLAFGGYDANLEGIREVQQGIMDFVKEYHRRFRDFPYMLRISGRDAYAPMLVAASHNEKYLKEMEKKFKLEINVN